MLCHCVGCTVLFVCVNPGDVLEYNDGDNELSVGVMFHCVSCTVLCQHGCHVA